MSSSVGLVDGGAGGAALRRAESASERAQATNDEPLRLIRRHQLVELSERGLHRAGCAGAVDKDQAVPDGYW